MNPPNRNLWRAEEQWFGCFVSVFMDYDFDVIIIGSGVAAATVAGRCRKAGRSVAIIDELPFGGTCALRGCDPKKLLRRGPEVADWAALMEGCGIVSDGLHIDWPALVAFKRRFTDPVPETREKGFEENGIVPFRGTAHFIGKRTVAVGDNRLEGRRIVIATGAQPRPLEIPGENLVTTSTEFMELERLPQHILFIGGGYISFEFAHMAARAGSRITMLTRGDRPLRGFDSDLVGKLIERSKSAGIQLQTHADVKEVTQEEQGLRVCAAVAGRDKEFVAELAVHGAGRVPKIEALELDKANVCAGKGGIQVNEFLQSISNPSVFAAGDVAATGAPPLTPVSSLEGKTAAINLIEGNHARADYTGIPSVVFTIPALARVGLLESEAAEQGVEFTSKLTDMSNWFTTSRIGETHAAAKTLIEKGSGRIIGIHLLGPESGELINLFALAMRNGLTSDDLKNFIGAYPTAGSDVGYLV